MHIHPEGTEYFENEHFWEYWKLGIVDPVQRTAVPRYKHVTFHLGTVMDLWKNLVGLMDGQLHRT